MKRGNNKLYALTLLIATPAWITILIAKGRGAIGINWPAAILGAVWIPALTLAALLGLTGQKLDAIAKKHGLRRYPHETDEQLQSRIREAVLKNLEGGHKNGRV